MSATTILEAAKQYRARGWTPIPLSGKDPSINGAGWQERTYEDRDFEVEGRNVGLLTGERSKGLTDLDLDCAESRRVAPYFLPDTEAVFGRDETGPTHLLYVTKVRLPLLRLLDPLKPKDEKAVIAEYRDGTEEKAAQTMAPPSIHPITKETLGWYRYGDRAEVDAFDLHRRFMRLCSAALLATYWPGKGAGHHAANALSGGLVRMGWRTRKW